MNSQEIDTLYNDNGDVPFYHNNTDESSYLVEFPDNSPLFCLMNMHCSDNLFMNVCLKLDELGINYVRGFSSTSGNYPNVLVALDQQINSSDKNIIYAPYNNSNVGFSDALTLSMAKAFSNSRELCKIASALTNKFSIGNDGNVVSNVPTMLEAQIQDEMNYSFTTIALGTGTLDATNIANMLVDGLVRYYYFLSNDLSNEDNSTDLIYSVASNDSISSISNYFGVSERCLIDYNNIEKGYSLLPSQVVLNPVVENYDFLKNHDFNYSYSSLSNKSMK